MCSDGASTTMPLRLFWIILLTLHCVQCQSPTQVPEETQCPVEQQTYQLFMSVGKEHRSEDLTVARACFEGAVANAETKSQTKNANVQLGSILDRSGRHSEAADAYSAAVQGWPSKADAVLYTKLAGALFRADKIQECLGALESALKNRPGDTDATVAMAEVLSGVGEQRQSLTVLGSALANGAPPPLAEKPQKSDKPKPTKAKKPAPVSYFAVTEQNPKPIPASHEQRIIIALLELAKKNSLGGAAVKGADQSVAFEAYRTILAKDPNQRDALWAVGSMLHGAMRPQEAIPLYEKLVAIHPDYPPGGLGRLQLAHALRAIGRAADAVKHYEEVRAQYAARQKLDPNDSQGQEGEGEVAAAGALLGAVRARQALCDWTKPDDEALLMKLIRSHVLNVDPTALGEGVDGDSAVAAANAAHARADAESARAEGTDALPPLPPQNAAFLSQLLDPFLPLASSSVDARTALAVARTRAEMFASQARSMVVVEEGSAIFNHEELIMGWLPHGGRKRVVIAYLVRCWEDTLLTLTQSLLRSKSDRQRSGRPQIKIFALSPSRAPESWRRSVGHAMVDASSGTPLDAAVQINSDGVHVLVDLGAFHNKEQGMNIVAMRPAPVQTLMSIGWPGSSGAAFIDFLVADKIVTPPEFSDLYREKLIVLPRSFHINAHAKDDLWKASNRANLPTPPTRQSLGLATSADAVVVNFNRLHKVDAPTFALWMDVLKDAPGAQLLLLKRPAEAAANLLRTAREADVDDSRIVFVDPLARPQYASVLGSDIPSIAVDTTGYNSHTTAVDALWSGLPLISHPREKFTSRAAASILSAGNRAVFIARDEADYVALSARLATSKASLARVRKLYGAPQGSNPLFDANTWIKIFENAACRTLELQLTGSGRKHIVPVDVTKASKKSISE